MVTDRCNKSCNYCFNKETRKAQRSELNIQQWDSIITEITSAGVCDLSALGGEPLLRMDLLPIFTNLRKNNIRTQVITNGSLVSKDNIGDIVRAFNDITISLDSHIESHNDLNRGPGSYQGAIHAIDLLNDMNVPFHINAVLTKYTISDFLDMKRFFLKYKFCAEIKPVISERTSKHDPFSPSLSQIDAHYSSLYNLLYSDGDISLKASDIRQGLVLTRCGCGAATSEFAIGPDGSLYPCRSLYFDEFNCGIIQNTGFEELWKNSPVLQKVRLADHNRQSTCIDSDCDLFNFCLGGCFGNTFSTIGKLQPWASDFDCYKFKQIMRHNLLASVKIAERGESVLKKI